MSPKRLALSVSLLVAVGLVAAGSAGAVTITGWVGGKAAVPQVVTAAGNCPGTVITINGTGFVSDGGITSVTIGGVPAGEVTIGSDSIMFARVGANASNGGSVTVTTRAGTATSNVPLIVYPCQSTGVAGEKPTVDSLSPKSAKAGAKLTLNGMGYVGTKTVTVGGEKANYSIPSDNLMYIRLPSDLKAGSQDIVIINNLGIVKTSVTVK
jgi:hypothetical protein